MQCQFFSGPGGRAATQEGDQKVRIASTVQDLLLMYLEMQLEYLYQEHLVLNLDMVEQLVNQTYNQEI